MILLNLVSRIDDDKNSFLDLVYIAYELKQAEIINFKVLFIGGIHKVSIYQNILRMAYLLGVTEHIDFTKKSVPLKDLPAEIKKGYFFNYTVGNFFGYSAIESVELGFKTIFCNCDQFLSSEWSSYINFCPDIGSAIELIKLISREEEKVSTAIFENNIKMKAGYFLSQNDKTLLFSMLSPSE